MKRILKLIVLLILISPIYVLAATNFDEYDLIKYEYGDYSTAQKIVKEMMKSYYIRGRNIQYNYAKTKYPIGVPEEATWQDNNYSVCAAYTYSIYNQSFGMIYRKSSKYANYPRYNYNISDDAYSYYKSKIENESGNNKGDGTFLIYYQHALYGEHDDNCKIENIHKTEDEKIKYLYGDTNTSSPTGDFKTLLDNLKPGDLVVYSGHALIVYDVVTNPVTKEKDAIILNSTADEYIGSRITGTSKISYNLFPSPSGINGAIDVSEEGSIQFLWLSKMKQFVTDGTLTCKAHECAVIRPFYEQAGKAIFNYPINEIQYNKANLRTQYPGLLIEKTVSTGDNNSVNLGDVLKYQIKITNKSGVDYSPKAYGAFAIEEELNRKELQSTADLEKAPTVIDAAKVTYISSDGHYDSNDDTITWNISSLKSGETINLYYEVVVDNKIENINKEVLSIGKFYSPKNSSVHITTGTVRNPVIIKNSSPIKSFSSCYDSKKASFSGLELIDEVYKCAYGKSYKISFKNNFTFGDLFYKTVSDTPKTDSKIEFNPNEQFFSRMILNNYYSGLVFKYSSTDKKDLYYLPRFTETRTRARTINSQDFKTGDVLIYYITDKTGTGNKVQAKRTNEDGLYAYVYIDGKFVGVNGTIEDKTKRDEFTYKYYLEDHARHVSESTCQDNFKISKSQECDLRYYLWNGFFKEWENNSPIDPIEFANYQTLFDKDYYVILRPLVDEIIDISFTKPTKTKYIQNYESLDLTGGKIKVVHNDKSTDEIKLTNKDVNVTGFDNNNLGTKTIKIDYKGYTTTYDVEIVSKQAEKIKLTVVPTKTKYIQDLEELDLTGGEILVTYNDKSTDKISLTNEKVKVTGFDNSKKGINTLTATYEGSEPIEFYIEIVSNEISNINVSKSPLKQKYIQDLEELDLTGGELAVTYSDGTTDKISLTNKNIKVTGFDNSELGTNKLTVEYNGYKTTFDVEIVSKLVSGISLTKLPLKKNYIQNYENLDLTGGELAVTYSDGTTDKMSLTNENIKVSGFDSSKLGTNIITIEYEQFTTNFNVEILTQQINKIEVTKMPSKVKVIKGTKELDLSGGEITITYNDESIDVVSLTNENIKVTGFDSSEYGKNTITIEYLGRTTTIDIEIISRLEAENPNTGAVIGIGLILIILGSGIFYTLTRNKSKFLRHN